MKSIALVVPSHFSIYESIVDGLRASGLDVKLLVVTDTKFKYKNLLQRGINAFEKIKGNKNFKKELIENQDSRKLLDALKETNEKFDYALVIRPDLINTFALKKLKNRSNNMIAYQWDGLSRYPNVFKLIPLFDRFYVFDLLDFRKYASIYNNLYYSTNFYFDHHKNINITSNKKIYYRGSYLKERVSKLFTIAKILDLLKVDSSIFLYSFDLSKIEEKPTTENIIFTNKHLKYHEIINEVRHCGSLLELQNNDIHSGLSFRVFEALHFRKKIITDNVDIKNYDFYVPNNIFVITESNSHEIKDFLKTPYKHLEDDIYKKYAFSTWISNVLNANLFQKNN